MRVHAEAASLAVAVMTAAAVFAPVRAFADPDPKPPLSITYVARNTMRRPTPPPPPGPPPPPAPPHKWPTPHVPPRVPTLPRTGMELSAAALAFPMVLLGAVLVFVGRRRTQGSSPRS
ncbi:LPXTG-motif cell wall-anchored protein [Catenulispora sp. GP43]|uniref:LPXTG cell wall anchor domain-containing protein n=1 Tax=Catenulispora sp. GP43 TaxID=3156263 RepID=UPI003517DED4